MCNALFFQKKNTLKYIKRIACFAVLALRWVLWLCALRYFSAAVVHIFLFLHSVWRIVFRCEACFGDELMFLVQDVFKITFVLVVFMSIHNYMLKCKYRLCVELFVVFMFF